KNNLFQLGMYLLIVILINIIGSFLFTRFDLTAEKRYSLSPATKTMLKELDDIVFFRVYLDGEFPAGFKRLKNETKEMLDEFRAYSNNIEYEFINPSESGNSKERNDTYQLLVERGLNPTNLQVKTKESNSQQIIFPGALVSYKNHEVPLQLLISQMGISSEQIINNSVKQLEYNIINAIRKLAVREKPKIAFIEGHGELDKMQVYDITNALSEFYTVERVKIDEKVFSLTKRDSTKDGKIHVRNLYKAIIIAKPDSVFSEKDKFIIDQFIMRGGKVLWLIDPVSASMDSLQNTSQTMGIANEINLEDQLFNYGVRLNNNLLMDLTCLPISMVTGMIGNQPQISLFPWYYFPAVFSQSEHPVVNNLNAVKFEFASSLDTVGTSDIKKTILLTTSKYTKIVNTPALIDLEICRNEPDESQFNSSSQPVAILLEGKFESFYRNRIPPALADNKYLSFVEYGEPSAMMVISDGDVIKNQFLRTQGTPLPLGYDQDTRQSFGNKDLILNIMNYFCDDSGLLATRTREVQLRLLDSSRIENEGSYWKLLNVIVPILLVGIFGWIQFLFRKRKYTR
ncbi:MAG: gliding motility-associated ABC transporter substrate-binding protein GldG, partial [Lentimicrobiaceae bacterium]|nr:gliding motility-associated ABC transporter substrate-binding protein GldG [Lentimicrobiaceae bacterium]